MSPNENLPSFDKDYRFKHTAPPNPLFNYRDPVTSTEPGKDWADRAKEGWEVFDISKESPAQIYKLMISGIVPRPIAFVSTLSEDGIANLAPFRSLFSLFSAPSLSLNSVSSRSWNTHSWFNQVSPNPPLLSISISANSNPDGSPRPKDTVANIKTIKELTVNIISEPFIENANITSIDVPHGVDELEISGLTKEPDTYVKPPRVLESAFSMECTLYAAHDIPSPTTGKVSTTLIRGLVKYIHVKKDMLTENRTVDPARFRAVGKLEDVTYARVGEGFRLARPQWEEEKDKIERGSGKGSGPSL